MKLSALRMPPQYMITMTIYEKTQYYPWPLEWAKIYLFNPESPGFGGKIYMDLTSSFSLHCSALISTTDSDCSYGPNCIRSEKVQSDHSMIPFLKGLFLRNMEKHWRGLRSIPVCII